MKKVKHFILTKSIGLYINFLSFVNPKKATGIAYKLFSNPREGRLIDGQLPTILQDAETSRITYNEHQFQTYTWKGNNHTILLIHGWESNASRWEKLLPYLKDTGSTIIAIDGPAHGMSSGSEFNIPRYAEFINVAVEKFRPNALIGHSIGGAACVYFQYKYENPLLQKMVILGAPSDLQVLLDNYIKLLSLNSKISLLLEKYFITTFNFKPNEFSGKIFGQKLKLKGLIAHDTDDTVVAFEEANKIAGSWKHAEFITTTGLGHSMHDDKLYQRVTAFLSE